MEAVILIGIQGSGKTTFYKTRFFETHIRISLDMLRTRRREELLFAACLEARQPFVIDNTNPRAADRARYIGRSRVLGFRVIGYFLIAPLADAIRRNARRPGKAQIPPVAIGGTLRKLEMPKLSEGFDELYLVHTLQVDAPNDGKFIVEPLSATSFS